MNRHPIHGGGHRDPKSFQVRIGLGITQSDAKDQGFEPITKRFGEGELSELANAWHGFQGCRVVLVAVEGGFEIWRASAEVTRWSQYGEVNEMTALRSKAGVTRKLPGHE